MTETILPKDSTSEISLLTGFSGCLALILGVVPISLSMALSEINEKVPRQFIGFTAALVLSLLLLAAINDLLITKTGRLVVRIGALILAVAGLTTQLMPGFGMFAPVAIAASISLYIMFWGAYLTTLNHKTLTLFLLLATVFAGFTGILVYYLDTSSLIVFSFIMFSISWLISCMMPAQIINDIQWVNKVKSRDRNVRGLGNRYTLFEVGLMLGASTYLARGIVLPPQSTALVLGGCVVFAGLIMMLAYVLFKERSGSFLKRNLTAIMAVSLLLNPLFGARGQAVFVFILIVFVTLNAVFIVDAISETARFNIVSPFWIIGIEGGVLFSGALAAQLIFTAENLLLGWSTVPVAAIVIVTLCCALQITINNQSYPIFEIFEHYQPNYLNDQEVAPPPQTSITANDQENDQENKERDRIHGAVWRQKLEIVTERYRLSPKQAEIMRNLLKGRNSLYIMERFNISKSTAKTHIFNLYKKLEIHSRQELLDMFEAIDPPTVFVQTEQKARGAWKAQSMKENLEEDPMP